MTDVASLIEDMVRAGVDPELIGRTAAALVEREPVVMRDEQAERRRAMDRERKRLRNSAESAETAAEKERPHTPKENPPLQKKNPPLGVKKKSSPPSCLPSDWRASEPERAYAASLGFSAPETDRIEADFRDYWLAKAKDATKRDWTATWQRWCRQEADKRGKRPMPAEDGKPVNAPKGVFVAANSDEWLAWARHLRATTGRVPSPQDFRDENGITRRGWYFPTREPPPTQPLRATA